MGAFAIAGLVLTVALCWLAAELFLIKCELQRLHRALAEVSKVATRAQDLGSASLCLLYPYLEEQDRRQVPAALFDAAVFLAPFSRPDVAECVDLTEAASVIPPSNPPSVV